MEVEKEAMKIKAAYKAAADRLAAVLQRLDPDAYSESTAAAVMTSAQEIVGSLNARSRAWARRALTTAYEDERRISKNRLVVIGAEPGRGGKKRHERAKAALIRQTLRDLFKANATFERTAQQYLGMVRAASRGLQKLEAMSPELTTRIGGLAKKAVKDGLARQTLKNQIRKLLDLTLRGRDFISIRGKDGVLRDYKAGKYAEMVARTRLREAASEATVNAAREYDHDLVEIPAKGGSCEDCIEIEGQVYSLTGDTPGYPVLTDEERPPIHPNCRHYLRVTSESSLAFRKAVAEGAA